jgi:cytochrome c556
MFKGRVLTIASGLVAVTLATSAVFAASPIEERQAAMKAVGKAMGELAKIAKQEKKFDAATVKADAQTIHDKLGTAKALFPEGSDKGHKTRALAAIWKDRQTFDAALKRAEEASLAMTQVTSEKAFMPAINKLGGACKNCHDKFRKPEE